MVHSFARLAAEVLTRRCCSRARKCRSSSGHCSRGSARNVRAAESEHVVIVPLPRQQPEREGPPNVCGVVFERPGLCRQKLHDWAFQHEHNAPAAKQHALAVQRLVARPVRAPGAQRLLQLPLGQLALQRVP